MNEKINLQELINLLSQKSGITKKEAEIFLKECFDTINNALLEEQSVKIKNLGSFKLSQVSDRESIDVVTGARVLIPAHYKVNFSADNNLAQIVNEPFSYFDPVEVNENDEVILSEEKIVFSEEEDEEEDFNEIPDNSGFNLIMDDPDETDTRLADSTKPAEDDFRFVFDNPSDEEEIKEEIKPDDTEQLFKREERFSLHLSPKPEEEVTIEEEITTINRPEASFVITGKPEILEPDAE
ncbi:MAG: HU family DNA-binding protein, partial [Candidatus Symbiothrix sp.]|nr:HU family DNA-binding protein [Candidatus Symbiothrix sp.]